MSELAILIAGDYSPKERFQDALDKGNYPNLFPGLKNIISSVDFSVVNFETTVRTTESLPIPKIGSHLSCKENAFEALRYLGFKMLTMANNHIMDYGRLGMENSKRIAVENGFEVIGVGKNLEDARCYKIVENKGKRVAFINECENEFSIATEENAGCNPLDIVNISYDIRAAKESADYVIVIIHGGNEHYKLPSPRMKKNYRFFVDQGADAVLNHHQHCYSGYEVYNGKPIFYGLGNFCFDSANDIEYRHMTYNYGYMVKLLLSERVSFELIPYEQCYNKVGVYLLDKNEKAVFFEDINKLNAIISNDAQLKSAFVVMAEQKRNFIFRGFRPYTSRIASALYNKGLLPSFLSKERLMIITAILECEAHNEVLMVNLKREK